VITKRPRVIGLEDLLTLDKPLRERPAPLVYLTDAEFSRLTKALAACGSKSVSAAATSQIVL